MRAQSGGGRSAGTDFAGIDFNYQRFLRNMLQLTGAKYYRISLSFSAFDLASVTQRAFIVAA